MFSAAARSLTKALPFPFPSIRLLSSSSTTTTTTASKRTPSSYILFAKDQRPVVKAENPSASFGDINRKLGQMWQALGEAEKKVYIDKAAELKAATK